MENNGLVFLQKLLQNLYKKDIVFVPLRYKPFVKEYAYSGDYDFIAKENDFIKILQEIFVLATQMCINFDVNRKKYGKNIITIYDDFGSITIEIWYFLDLKPMFSMLGYIFWEDLEHVIVKNEKGFSFRSEFEALFYLTHLYTKKKNLDESLVKERINYYKEKVIDKEIKEFFLQVEKEKEITKDLLAKVYQKLFQQGVLFPRSNKEKFQNQIKILVAKQKRKIVYFVANIQKNIVVIGADGVGKSSIIDSSLKILKQKRIKVFRFKKLFRHSILYKVFRFLHKKDAKKLEKNQFDDLFAKELFFIALIRYPFLIMYRIIRGKIYFFDRYFYDLFFYNIRFLQKSSSIVKNWKSLLKITPKPLWLIHLDAPIEVIFSRKKELTSQSISLYKKGIFQIYLQHDLIYYSYINTVNKLEQTTNIVTQNFLERFKK